MRDLEKLVKEIISVIPYDENRGLVEDLERHLDSILFTAPEIMGLRWRSVGETLGDYISEEPINTPCWQKTVIELWTGK